MFRVTFIGFLTAMLLTFTVVSAEAQRRGGRGGGGGRGGFSPSRSYSRPAPTQHRGQSMSSRTPSRSSVNRTPSRSTTNRGTANRSPNRSTVNRGTSRSSANRSAASGNRGASSRSNFSSPSRSQLDSFLSSGGGKSGASSASSRSRGAASTQPSNPGSGWNSKTYTTARGTEITVGGGSGAKSGSGGGGIAAKGGGIKIETASGKTATKGGIKAVGGDGSGNVAGGRAGGKSVSDGRGNSAGVVAGGGRDSQGNFKGGVAGGAKNQYGYARVGGRGTAGNVNSGNRTVKQGAAVKGPYGNVVSAGRGAQFQNGQFVGGKSWAAVNGNYTRYNYFGPGYYGRYPGAWWPGKWAVASTAWAAATWATAGSYCGCSDEGTYYDYGESVTYEDGQVYYEGEAVATEEEYYDEAAEIADAGQASEDEEWMPLGVFAVIKDPEQTETERVIQLALNRDGAIRGNMHDMLTEKVTPITGSVNKETQKVAMKLEGNDQVLVETGLYNLTNDEVPALVHLSEDKRQEVTLIRLQNPEEEEGEK